MDKLVALGVRTVPVIARGNSYVFAQNFDDIAEFVGVHGSGHVPLSPDVLVTKWLRVLRSVQHHVRQVPSARLGEPVIPNRNRSIRLLGHHVFRIGEAFLETVVDGAEYAPLFANKPPEDGQFTTGEMIAFYGDDVIQRLERWWDALEDRSCMRTVSTFFGDQSMHMLLERSTWHSAQHGRQFVAVLERMSIEPGDPLTADDLAGLPLPERLWE